MLSEETRDTDPAPPPRTDLSLGERCVEWCVRQWQGETRPTIITLTRWFMIAERNGQPLRLKISETNRPNYCAMAQCNAAFESRISGEAIPHKPRAAAKELMADAIKFNAWHSAAEVAQGFRPRTGDLAIYDRSTPGKPETQWFGHVNRIIELVGTDAYRAIGANEGPRGEWKESVRPFAAPRLLGFISYPTLDPVQREPTLAISDSDREHVNTLRGLSLLDAEGAYFEDTYNKRG